jgi:quercetin dioxygenase-like cupin family protein
VNYFAPAYAGRPTQGRCSDESQNRRRRRGAAGKHTHPGEELGYVLEGTLLLEVAGQPPRTLKAGEAFFIPAGTVHDGKNVGSGPAKVLATYIVEKGKPVASPAK